MEIERKYYTEHKKWLDGIDDDLRKTRESMTEEEKLKERRQNEKGFQRLLEKIEKEQKRNRRVVDLRKKAYFEDIVKVGDILAQKIDADFIAKSDETSGKICLITSLVLFGKPDGYSGRNELVLLVRMADDITVTPEGNMIKWEFRFNFYDVFVS